MREKLPAYAIVRVDLFQGALDEKPSEHVSVKRIMWESSKADAEVARLNALNGGKGCVYSRSTRRVDPPDPA